MSKWIRHAIWMVAVGAGLSAVIWALIYREIGHAVALLIVAGLMWFGLAWLMAFRFGVARIVRRYLGARLDSAESLEHRIPHREVQDVARALESLYSARSNHSHRIGVESWGSRLIDRLIANPEPTKLRWESLQTAEGAWEETPSNATYLLTIDNAKVAACISQDQDATFEYGTGDQRRRNRQEEANRLEIVALSREATTMARDAIMQRAREVAVVRGNTVLVRPADRGGQTAQVEFTHVEPVDLDQIVLPKWLLDVVDRTVLQQLDASEKLEAAGHRTRTAILLHGPPGTGKTLLTRNLISRVDGFTTILLHGFQRGLVREAFRLARYCEPSLVILEDVDLVAVKRGKNSRGTTALHELLDELDGLAPAARCAVIMTTNRPDVLEPALASRPGRVTQAIAFPMPDHDSRLKLLELFTRKLDVSAVDLGDWAARTDGASPAFLEELTRRAILFADERAAVKTERPATTATRLSVIADDLEQAIREIVEFGGILTRNLLGEAAPEPLRPTD